MKKSNAETFRKGFQSLGSIFYYLFYCPLRDPQQSLDFLKNVYLYQKTDRVRRLDSSVIPTLPAEQLFPGLFERPAQLLELGGKWQTGVSLFESYVFASIVRLLQPHTLFEFGTFEGITTLQLALNSLDDAVVYTLDLPDNIGRTQYPLSFPEESQTRTLPVGGIFCRYPLSRKIRQLYGDSAAADFQDMRGKVDFVFVDGDHGYDYVRSDTENAFSMLSSKGVIVWHDYGSKWKDVSLFLRELATQREKEIFHLESTNLAVHITENAFAEIQTAARIPPQPVISSSN
jgi:hypothetical protein